MLSLEESRMGTKQNQSVKRLTQLAFIFIPLSFITSLFGMNIDVLTGAGTKWWTVVIGAVIVYVIVGISYAGVLGIEKRRARQKSPQEVERKQSERKILKEKERTNRKLYTVRKKEEKEQRRWAFEVYGARN